MLRVLAQCVSVFSTAVNPKNIDSKQMCSPAPVYFHKHSTHIEHTHQPSHHPTEAKTINARAECTTTWLYTGDKKSKTSKRANSRTTECQHPVHSSPCQALGAIWWCANARRGYINKKHTCPASKSTGVFALAARLTDGWWYQVVSTWSYPRMRPALMRVYIFPSCRHEASQDTGLDGGVFVVLTNKRQRLI